MSCSCDCIVYARDYVDNTSCSSSWTTLTAKTIDNCMSSGNGSSYTYSCGASLLTIISYSDSGCMDPISVGYDYSKCSVYDTSSSSLSMCIAASSSEMDKLAYSADDYYSYPSATRTTRYVLYTYYSSTSCTSGTESTYYLLAYETCVKIGDAYYYVNATAGNYLVEAIAHHDRCVKLALTLIDVL